MTCHHPRDLGPTLPTVGHAWVQFCRTHADWLSSLPRTNPLYCLSESIITCLERPRRRRPPLLDRRAAGAEPR